MSVYSGDLEIDGEEWGLAGALILLLMITVVPYILGSGLIRNKDGGAYALLFRYAAGWVVLYGLFYLPALVCTLMHTSLDLLIAIYLVILLAAAVYSLRILIRERINPLKEAKELFLNPNVILPSVLILGHSLVTFFMMHLDDDDYSYIGTAATSVYTNTLMVYNGGTGAVLKNLETDGMNRLVAAPQFAFYAFLSKISGIRAVTICHSILPPVFTVLFFTAFLMIARELFGDDRRKCGIFMVFCFVISAFSGFSTFTSGSFVMLRSWQGKAQIVGLILPLIIAFGLRLIRVEKLQSADVIMLTALLSAASLQTAMGAVLAAMAAGLFLLLVSFMKKSGSYFVKCLPAFVIPAICALVYLKIR